MRVRMTAIMSLFVCWAASALAQGQPGQNAPVLSPEVQADRRVTFRLVAPQAEAVRLNAGDIPNVGSGAMTKNDKGVWELTLGPLEPGAYRYTFNLGGINIVDPRTSAISESNNNVWSLVVVPGSEWMDTKDVPHGAVASVNYYSTALSKFRRMHVYTPPGYESGKGKYPVFYLLHGAGDNDNAWTTVGRAGFILDNLIAAKKAKPMIVVMPAGHTRRAGEASPTPPSASGNPFAQDEFTKEFTTDIMPHVEKNYRTLSNRANRAIAGLSMGGYQTLNIAVPQLDKFAYVGVYSSGLFGIVGNPRGGAGAPQPNFTWENDHRAELDNAEWRKGLKLFWIGTGKDDFLLNTSRATVEMFKKHGFPVVYEETGGGHTWLVWRDYLQKFAPMLFQ
jgi:enterochelin esterase-like enzyme